MSSLLFSLVAGIDTLETFSNGTICDDRYHPSVFASLEDLEEWSVKLPTLDPVIEQAIHERADLTDTQSFLFNRYCFIRDMLSKKKDATGNIPASEVLFWEQESSPGLLGYLVDSHFEPGYMGHALAGIEDRFFEPGYKELARYTGRYKYTSPSLPKTLQAIQGEHWQYPSFTDTMPYFAETFLYLCQHVGFSSPAYDTIKLYLAWRWV